MTLNIELDVSKAKLGADAEHLCQMLYKSGFNFPDKSQRV